MTDLKGVGDARGDAFSQWERLLDVDRVRSVLVDLGAFLVAYAIFEAYFIGKPRDFLSFPVVAADADTLDQRVVGGDLNGPQRGEIRKAACEWLVEMKALDSAEVAQFNAVRALRNRVAHESFDPLVYELQAELLTAVIQLDALFEKLERWWILEVEASIQPEAFDLQPGEPEPEVQSMARTLMHHVLRVAQDGIASDTA